LKNRKGPFTRENFCGWVRAQGGKWRFAFREEKQGMTGKLQRGRSSRAEKIDLRNGKEPGQKRKVKSGDIWAGGKK